MSNKSPGRFFVLSAPSGAGKTTLINRLLVEFPDMERSVSCTTRKPRVEEREGVDYHFVGEGLFREMIGKDLFFEWEKVHGAYYGTPKGPLLKRRSEGKDTILDIDTRGALNLKKSFGDAILIFLMPPSLDALEKRLRHRKTETEESIQRRLEDARSQIAEKEKFDYVIINDDIHRAYEAIKTIIKGDL